MILRRRRDALKYTLPKPTPFQAFTDNLLKLTGGCTTKTWRQRCEASLRASRRRRGLPPQDSHVDSMLVDHKTGATLHGDASGPHVGLYIDGQKVDDARDVLVFGDVGPRAGDGR